MTARSPTMLVRGFIGHHASVSDGTLCKDLEALTSPTSEQLDLFLEKFLVLPPGETDWFDLFHLFSYHQTGSSLKRLYSPANSFDELDEFSYFVQHESGSQN